MTYNPKFLGMELTREEKEYFDSQIQSTDTWDNLVDKHETFDQIIYRGGFKYPKGYVKPTYVANTESLFATSYDTERPAWKEPAVVKFNPDDGTGLVFRVFFIPFSYDLNAVYLKCTKFYSLLEELNMISTIPYSQRSDIPDRMHHLFRDADESSVPHDEQLAVYMAQDIKCAPVGTPPDGVRTRGHDILPLFVPVFGSYTMPGDPLYIPGARES